MVARAILIISLLVSVSNGFFFGTPRSECGRDSQCKTFQRYECLRTDELFLFYSSCSKSRPYTIPGKCVERNNLFCDLDNALNRGRRPANCRYRECARCLSSLDCWYGYTCRSFKCIGTSADSR